MRTRSLRGRTRYGRRAGAEILELALCLPILLGVAFATVQFGYRLYVMHTIQAAAREGARAAAPPAAPSGDSETDARTAVEKVMNTGGFKSANNDYTCDYSVTTGAAPMVTVKVTFQKDLLVFPMIGKWTTKPAAQVVMRKES